MIHIEVRIKDVKGIKEQTIQLVPREAPEHSHQVIVCPPLHIPRQKKIDERLRISILYEQISSILTIPCKEQYTIRILLYLFVTFGILHHIEKPLSFFFHDASLDGFNKNQ